MITPPPLTLSKCGCHTCIFINKIITRILKNKCLLSTSILKSHRNRNHTEPWIKQAKYHQIKKIIHTRRWKIFTIISHFCSQRLRCNYPQSKPDELPAAFLYESHLCLTHYWEYNGVVRLGERQLCEDKSVYYKLLWWEQYDSRITYLGNNTS